MRGKKTHRFFRRMSNECSATWRTAVNYTGAWTWPSITAARVLRFSDFLLENKNKGKVRVGRVVSPGWVISPQLILALVNQIMCIFLRCCLPERNFTSYYQTCELLIKINSILFILPSSSCNIRSK